MLATHSASMTYAERPSAALPFDVLETLDRLGGDESLFATIARSIIESVPELEGALRDALGEGDHRQVRAAAHALKGAMLTVSAEPSAALAARIEDAARGGDAFTGLALYPELRRELGRVVSAMARYASMS